MWKGSTPQKPNTFIHRMYLVSRSASKKVRRLHLITFLQSQQRPVSFKKLERPLFRNNLIKKKLEAFLLNRIIHPSEWQRKSAGTKLQNS